MRYILIILSFIITPLLLAGNKNIRYKFNETRVIFGDSVTLSWEAPKRFHVQIEGVDSLFENKGSVKVLLKEKERLNITAFKGKQTLTRKTRALRFLYPEFNYFIAERNKNNPEEIIVQWSVKNYKNIAIDKLGTNLEQVGIRKINEEKEVELRLEAEMFTGEKYVRFARIPEVFLTERKFISNSKKYNINDSILFFMEIISADISKYPDEIELKVIAYDTVGNFISNLAPPYGSVEKSKEVFRKLFISDNSGEKTISFKVTEIHEEEQEKTDMAFVMDYSGSMSPVVHNFKEISSYFVSKKSPHDRMSLIAFDHRIYKLNELTSDTDELKKVILENDKLLGGSTALYAASDEGMQNIRNSSNEKILLVFTDGHENASFPYYGFRATDANTLSNRIRKTKTKLFVIGYGQMVNYEVLDDLCRLSNGKFYYINNFDDLKKALFEIGFIIKTYYKITFKPPSSAGPHDVKLIYHNENTDLIIENDYFIGEVEHLVEKEMPVYLPVIIDSVELVIPPQVIANFQYNKSFIEDRYKSTLNFYAGYLVRNQGINVMITGHSDSRGNERVRQRISRERAETVATYFITHGIDAKRVKTQYYSFSKPLHQVEDMEWKARENRRVEIILYREVK